MVARLVGSLVDLVVLLGVGLLSSFDVVTAFVLFPKVGVPTLGSKHMMCNMGSSSAGMVLMKLISKSNFLRLVSLLRAAGSVSMELAKNETLVNSTNAEIPSGIILILLCSK